MNLRSVVIEPAQGAQRHADLVLHPASHFRRSGFQLFQGKCKAGHDRLFVIGVHPCFVDGSKDKGGR